MKAFLKRLNKRREKPMRHIIRILVMVIIAIGFSTITVSAGNTLKIRLEARPSAHCFPASALQISELEEDFSRICKDCEIVPSSSRESDFRIVVEDPDYSWILKIYDRKDGLVKQMKWSGGLNTGLQKAVGFMHSHSSPN